MAEYYPPEGIEQILKSQSAYYSELDLSSFSAIFGNVSESYKFYWTEAILNRMAMFPDQKEFSLSALADQMIADAWYTVTEYHLRLGIVNSNARSSDGGLEQAVKDLQNAAEQAGREIKSSAKKSEVLDLLKEFGEEPVIRKDKVRLPVWNQYFRNYAGNQFRMYETVFSDDSVRSQFEKCRKDNLTSIWGAEELYIPNHSQTEFMSILEKNLRPVYDAAKQQGYGLWERMNAYSAALQGASGYL